MRRRRSIGSGPDHGGKERYKGEKDAMHKRREERKPEQREVESRRKKSERSRHGRPNTCGRSYKKPARDR
jgi:hypothetical protein